MSEIPHLGKDLYFLRANITATSHYNIRYFGRRIKFRISFYRIESHSLCSYFYRFIVFIVTYVAVNLTLVLQR